MKEGPEFCRMGRPVGNSNPIWDCARTAGAKAVKERTVTIKPAMTRKNIREWRDSNCEVVMVAMLHLYRGFVTMVFNFNESGGAQSICAKAGG